jgi:meso-butanediol dehydrogenase/(S,S)-butanediol dehydrogenase/diacetyl reductase
MPAKLEFIFMDGDEMKLKGKVALITGAGTGMGTEMARSFVMEGAKVCITGRRQAMLDKVVQTLPPGTIIACSGDVTRWDDAQRMVQTAIGFGGKLDVVVNNAAIDPGGSVVDIDPEVWRTVMDINVNGPFLIMKAAIPAMIQNGGGSIINMASLGGVRCLPGMSAYCTSKAALIMMTQQVALDYGPSKIRCNVICPGATRTESLEGALAPLAKALSTDVDGIVTRLTANVPLRRGAMPAEMCGPCVFLASDDSSFITGAVLMVDGGAAIVDVSGAALSNIGVDWGAAMTAGTA